MANKVWTLMNVIVICCGVTSSVHGQFFVDLRENFLANAGAPAVPLETGFHGPTGFCPAEFENCGNFADEVLVDSNVNANINLVGLAFLELIGDGTADITTIYGVDLEPASDIVFVGGFDPVLPQLEFSNERFFGVANQYDGVPIGVLPISQLAVEFPHFDLSPFDLATRDSVVFAFSTVVDLGDIPLTILGDVNQDGSVDLLDVEPFVAILTGAGFQPEADINQDGLVNLLDVGPFVNLLSG